MDKKEEKNVDEKIIIPYNEKTKHIYELFVEMAIKAFEKKMRERKINEDQSPKEIV